MTGSLASEDPSGLLLPMPVMFFPRELLSERQGQSRGLGDAMCFR